MIAFYDKNELPKLTDKGFEVITLPWEIQNLLRDFYNLLRTQIEPEENITSFIADENKQTASYLMDIHRAPSWVNLIAEKIKPIMLGWINNQSDLIFTSFYGMRRYTTGAKLVSHTDRIETHHISGIIMIDYEGAQWALDIQNHQGDWEKVFVEPGQMILYESAVCQHGRIERFSGQSYTNCYIHYKLANYEYVKK